MDYPFLFDKKGLRALRSQINLQSQLNFEKAAKPYKRDINSLENLLIDLEKGLSLEKINKKYLRYRKSLIELTSDRENLKKSAEQLLKEKILSLQKLRELYES